MHVSLHIKPKGSKSKHENPAAIILAYQTGDDGGAFARMFKSRGIDGGSLGVRPCKQDEVDECAHPHRLTYLMYGDWDALINDEKKFEVSEDWIQTLEGLKGKYPQFVKQ